MTRWPLSTAALLFVLAAHLAAALADEPVAPRPVAMTGRVVFGTNYDGKYSYDLVPTRGLWPRKPRSYPLVPTSDAHRVALIANVRRPRDVEVVGVLSSIALPSGEQPYLAIESIKELP